MERRSTAPWKLALTALGVVYGDIGTSPLYALRECFSAPHGVEPTRANVFGVLSLVFWALTLVIVVKYLTFIMRADNRGEGGILALLALLPKPTGTPAKKRIFLVLIGLFGAALLYGDGMITPAISVLSAVEGLGVATHALDHVVLPITATILVGLFLIQRSGTDKVGRLFGPATLVWFLAIAAAGAPWIARHPEILGAIDPRHAVSFFIRNAWHAFLVLGAVVLCITGGEALYADMGHFGPRPIRIAWYGVVFPALLVNYFGQGALYLERGATVSSPFYELVDGWLRYPMVAIATLATVVASQALISGAFSLTRQAVQLGYWPRMTIVHTSDATEGQIYMPEVNQALMVACLILVFMFKSSSALAAAYGIAVTGTMAITTILFFAVSRARKIVSPAVAVILLVVFLTIDLSFFAANATKLFDGGWFPIAIAGAMFILMTTWKRGRAALGEFMARATLPIDVFLADVAATKLHRVRGTGVFMTSNAKGVPPVLLHYVKHSKTLHEYVVLLAVGTEAVPEVCEDDRWSVDDLGQGFYRLNVRYGFMESPKIPVVLERCAASGLPFGKIDVSYFLGRETLLTTGDSRMARWRKRVFAFMSRNAIPATSFFGLPTNRVVELGTQVEL